MCIQCEQDLGDLITLILKEAKVVLFAILAARKRMTCSVAHCGTSYVFDFDMMKYSVGHGRGNT